MAEKTEKMIFFGITVLAFLLFIYFNNRYVEGVLSKLKPIKITFEDSLYLEISSIRYNDIVKVRIVNDSLKWCGSYNSIPENAAKEDHFTDVYLNFKLIYKKANNDTLITLDRNRNMRYYNIRSGPCYDVVKDVNE